MIDHVGILVKDVKVAKEFYIAVLEPLGYKLLMEPVPVAIGFGKTAAQFWVTLASDGVVSPTHVGFQAPNRAAVDAFYKAAIAAGAKDNGPPGVRAHYHPNYYAAFVIDKDGNNIEAVYHGAP